MRSLVFLTPVLTLFSSCQGPVHQSLKKTDELFVYEGLPHPVLEGDSFEEEKKRKDLLNVEGHWFYNAKVPVRGETRDRLMILLFDDNSFGVPGPHDAEKDCGDFHPDYAIAWKSEGEENYLMICYTCREAILTRDGQSKAYVLRGIEPWQELLAHFQDKRPQEQEDEIDL